MMAIATRSGNYHPGFDHRFADRAWQALSVRICNTFRCKNADAS